MTSLSKFCIILSGILYKKFCIFSIRCINYLKGTACIMKKSAIFVAFLLLLSCCIPTVSAAEELPHTETFVPETTVSLGWPGFSPLTVQADGSFLLGEEQIHFGYPTKIAQIDRPTPYPLFVHTFSDGDLFYTLQLFVNALTVDENACLALYARLTVENLSEENISYPAVSPRLVPLTQVPETVSGGEESTCDFAMIVAAEEGELPQADAQTLGTFDDRLSNMEAYWDTQLSGSFFFTEIPEEAKPFADNLKEKYIDLLCGFSAEDLALSALLGQLPGDISQMTCFDAALYYRKTQDESFLNDVWESLQTRYAEICDGLETYTFSAAGQEETVRLLPGEDADTALEDNLNALAEIKAFAYLSRIMDPEGEADVQSSYQALLSSIETVLRNTISRCTSLWAATNLSGSLSEGVFSLSADKSAAAAAAWYKKDAVFSAPGGGTYLKRLARQQLPYVQQEDLFSQIDAVVSQLEDGTIVLGQGLSGFWLSEGDTISFENYPLQDGGTLDCALSFENGEVQILLSPSTPTSVSLEFPIFLNNIEYASCGFDAENGIVSVPAGMTEITVRLREDPQTAAQSFQSERALEVAIAAYEGTDLTEYTNYSVSLFTPALENAKAARTGPASEMHRAAAALEEAAARLSRTQSGYTLTLSKESASVVGELEAEEICQVFTTEKAGTLEEIFLNGTFYEGMTAVLYDLQKDGYSAKDRLEEAAGVSAGGGILFQFSTELEADSAYLLSISSEDGSVSLPVYEMGEGVQLLYSSDGENKTSYALACTGLSLQITQANLADLDTFLDKCLTTDTSSYTRESRNRLEREMNAAKELLCTQSVTKEELVSVYDALKDAFASLATYPSDEPVEETPAALYVVLGAAIVLLIAGGIGAVAAYKKREW